MFELIISGYRWLFLQMASVLGPGWAIVSLSFICSALMAPLMKAVAGIVKRESDYQSVITPQLDAIKAKYASDMDRHLHIQRLYSRYSYSPLSAVKKVMPLFVQIPFLLLTYYMLIGTAELNGVPFLFLKDLGQADGLIPVLHANLIPLVMTGVNILTVFATPSFTQKDWTQAIGIALLFLVLLYTAPSALLLYWTLNNTITMVRTLVAKKGEGAKLLGHHVKLLLVACNPIRIVRCIDWPTLSWETPFVLVRNYLVLLLCVFLPALFLIFGHMPDRLEVEIRSDAPLSMTAGFVAADAEDETELVGAIVQGCPLGEHKDPVSFFLSDGCDTSALRIRLTGSEYRYRVSGLSLVRHLVFRYRLTYEVNDHVIRCAGEPIFQGVEIPNVKGSHLAVRGALGGLLILAVLGLFVRRNRAVPFEWRLSLAMAALAALFFTVILPCQTIFANRDAFDYPILDIVAQDGVVFLVAFAGLFAILSIASTVYGRWPHVILLGIFVYEYLQTGVLAINAPRMDGNMNYYWRVQPMMVDFAVIGLTGLLCLWKMSWIKTHFRRVIMWCGIALGISIGTTIYDATRQTPEKVPASQAKTVPWSFQRSQVAKGLRYSPVRNIIVLVLDSTQSDAAYAAAQVDAKIRASFDGFLAFNNHVGMHDNTYSGSVGLLTGEHYLNDIPLEEHFEKCFGPKSLITPYVEANDPVYVLPGIIGAYSNRIENRRTVAQAREMSSVFLYRVKPMNTSLLDVLQLRLVPFFLKKWDLQVMYLGSVVSDGTYEEHSLYPELAKCPVGDEARTSLFYIHTEGTHAPIRYDEFGNRLWSDKDNYRGLCDETHYILKSVAAYLDDLKKIGVYDNSMIIVTADHGCCFATPQLPKLANLPTRAVPMLWIKPIGSHGDLRTTEVATSHAKIAGLVRRARTENLSFEDCVSELHTPIRRFRVDYEGYVDWYIDEEGRRIPPPKE